jgi:hypothetical protein
MVHADRQTGCEKGDIQENKKKERKKGRTSTRKVQEKLKKRGGS